MNARKQESATRRLGRGWEEGKGKEGLAQLKDDDLAGPSCSTFFFPTRKVFFWRCVEKKAREVEAGAGLALDLVRSPIGQSRRSSSKTLTSNRPMRASHTAS
jgi:hypothetical protein